MHYDIITKDDEIIGFADDIIFHIKDELNRGRIDDDELTRDLLTDLENHDGLVRCAYHPMGAWHIADLVEA